MKFGNPEFFLLLLSLPLIALFFFLIYRAKAKALGLFASAPLMAKLNSSAGPSRYILKSTSFCLFALFAIFALVRPMFGVKMEMIERKGVDVMIALDISNSMLARDVAPNRLERAKFEIDRFINLLRGDRVGLIVFAGESYVQCPLTLDYAAARTMLRAVNTDWIDPQGTAIAEAIEQAVKSMSRDPRKKKALVIVSDGEDHEGNAEEAAKIAASAGIVIYTIGIGSETGNPIPVDRGDGSVAYKSDNDNNMVMTRLNPAMLRKIAALTNGKYFHAQTNLDLAELYGEISRMEKSEFGMLKAVVHEEQYQIFLLIAIIFILIEFFISERARKKEVWKGRFE